MFRRFVDNEESMIAGLREYWDAWLDGRPANEIVPEVDPALSSTVRRIHAIDDAPGASPVFTERLFAQMVARNQTVDSQSAALQMGSAPATVRPPAIRGAVQKQSTGRFRPSRIRVALSAGVTLLAALALAAGLMIWKESRHDQSNALIPAPTESTASNLAIETLFEISLPAGHLPENSRNQIGAGEFVIDPGETIVDAPASCSNAAELGFGLVTLGTVSLHSTGDVELTRADGEKEILVEGQEARLVEGDAWVYQRDRDEPSVSLTNDGTSQSHLLRSSWWMGESCAKAGPYLLWGGSKDVYDFDRTRPVSILVSRVTVPAGAVLTNEEAAQIGFVDTAQIIFVIAGVESGTLQEAWRQDDSAAPDMSDVQQELVDRSTANQAWMIDLNIAPPEGYEREFSTGADAPLVLTIFAFVYDDAG